MTEPVTVTPEPATPAVTPTPDPAEERLDVQIPPELLTPEVPAGDAEPETPAAAPVEPPAVTTAATPAAPVTPPSIAQPGKGGLFEQVENARKEHEAALARTRTPVKEEPEKPINYNDLEDLNAAFTAHDQRTQQRINKAVRGVQEQALTRIVTISQELARVQTSHLKRLKPDGTVDLGNSLDYDSVLERSGVLMAILPDPKTGQAPDPFLAQWVYSHVNPAQAAYEYGKGRLTEQVEATAELRGESRGKAAVVQQVVANASKPRSISSLPNSTAGQTGITRPQIDRMSDSQKARIKKEMPHVWRWYLGEEA